MANKKEKKFNFAFSSGEIMYTSVRKSSGGYNYASVGIKRGDNEYIDINYEWKTDSSGSIPDFSMDLLGFMSANKEEVEAATQELAAEYKEFAARLKDK